MIAVIFEVVPAEGRREDYLAMAADLRRHLSSIEGFISIERFASLADERKLVSISFWETEEAVTRWRTFAAHRGAQERGRREMFDAYRIRVASVVRDYSNTARDEVPRDIAGAP